MPSRSLFPAVVVALLLVLSGCQGGTTQGDTPTPTVEPTTATATPSPPTTNTSTTESDPVFNASVTYPNCTAVTVDAEEYRWVGVVTPERVYEYNQTMSGENTFETDAPVEFVLVYGSGDGRERVVNPGFEACIEARQTTEAPTPTPTPTATPTTVATMSTQTPTPTTVVTTQEPTTTYHTHTTQTTTREPLRGYKITTHVMNESLEDGYAKVRVKNWHEDTVRLDYDVVWQRDRDITENVDRHSLVLDPGESVVLESHYGGNGSAYEVEYKVNNLEYTNE